MAKILGAIATSHSPTIGFALDKQKQDERHAMHRARSALWRGQRPKRSGGIRRGPKKVGQALSPANHYLQLLHRLRAAVEQDL